MRPPTVVCVAVCALLAQACVYRWRPVDLQAPEADWARRVERADTRGASYVVTRRARLVDAHGEDARTLRAFDADTSVQVEGASLALDGAAVAAPDLLLAEVSYIDGGLTALNTVLWSLASTASAWGAAFTAVMISILQGDCRCAPMR